MSEGRASLFSDLREQASRPGRAIDGGAAFTPVRDNVLLALLDVAESAICRRFTVTSCRERPEVAPEDFCATCSALARLEALDG